MSVGTTGCGVFASGTALLPPSAGARVAVAEAGVAFTSNPLAFPPLARALVAEGELEFEIISNLPRSSVVLVPAVVRADPNAAVLVAAVVGKEVGEEIGEVGAVRVAAVVTGSSRL